MDLLDVNEENSEMSHKSTIHILMLLIRVNGSKLNPDRNNLAFISFYVLFAEALYSSGEYSNYELGIIKIKENDKR